MSAFADPPYEEFSRAPASTAKAINSPGHQQHPDGRQRRRNQQTKLDTHHSNSISIFISRQFRYLADRRGYTIGNNAPRQRQAQADVVFAERRQFDLGGVAGAGKLQGYDQSVRHFRFGAWPRITGAIGAAGDGAGMCGTGMSRVAERCSGITQSAACAIGWTGGSSEGRDISFGGSAVDGSGNVGFTGSGAGSTGGCPAADCGAIGINCCGIAPA